MLGSCLTAILS